MPFNARIFSQIGFAASHFFDDSQARGSALYCDNSAISRDAYASRFRFLRISRYFAMLAHFWRIWHYISAISAYEYTLDIYYGALFTRRHADIYNTLAFDIAILLS